MELAQISQRNEIGLEGDIAEWCFFLFSVRNDVCKASIISQALKSFRFCDFAGVISEPLYTSWTIQKTRIGLCCRIKRLLFVGCTSVTVPFPLLTQS